MGWRNEIEFTLSSDPEYRITVFVFVFVIVEENGVELRIVPRIVVFLMKIPELYGGFVFVKGYRGKRIRQRLLFSSLDIEHWG